MISDVITNNEGNLATVKQSFTDLDGRPVGIAHRNLLLNSREYEIDLEEGTADRISANKIDEDIYSQLDDEGRENLAFSDIIDHQRDDTALTKEEGFTTLTVYLVIVCRFLTRGVF